MATYLYQFAVGLFIVVTSGTGQISSLAYLQIALFGVALRRAWSLVEGKHLSCETS